MGWEKLWIVYVVCLAACSIGFSRYVWFMSVGYGLAVACGGLAILAVFAAKLNWLTILIGAVMAVYGFRLAYFLFKREHKSASYRQAMKGVSDQNLPLPVMICMWLMVAVLYTMQVSPLFFRLYNGCTDTAVPLIGALISICGTYIEALADIQKSEQKKINPDKVAMEGLYKYCRCPNYFGEMLMWLGVFVGGLTAYQGIGQWIMALLGFVLIWFVMLSGAKRLEIRQMKRCGNDPEFVHYCDTTPIIIPFVPLYHVAGKDALKQ